MNILSPCDANQNQNQNQTQTQEKLQSLKEKLQSVKEKLHNIKENMNNVLCVTRFNDETFREYQNFSNEEAYLKDSNLPENMCNVYNTPLPIAESKQFTNKYFFVLEMLNSNNTITGISVIKNRPYYKKFKVYSDQNYNRHSYKIITRISRTDLLYLEPILVSNLEKLVFTQKNHLKRGQGIQMIQTNYYKKLQIVNPSWESLDPIDIEMTILSLIWSMLEKYKSTIWNKQMIDAVDVK
mgnify:CR=1 FL=1